MADRKYNVFKICYIFEQKEIRQDFSIHSHSLLLHVPTMRLYKRLFSFLNKTIIVLNF